MKVADIDRRIKAIDEAAAGLRKIVTNLEPARFNELEREIGVRLLDGTVNGAVSMLEEYKEMLRQARDETDVPIGGKA